MAPQNQPWPSTSPRQQLSLLGHERPALDAKFATLNRVELARSAWVDYAPGWVEGHATLFDELARTIAWRAGEDVMYDRVVQVPRLFAVLPADGPLHPLIAPMQDALRVRYGEVFSRVSLALYRDGRDSVAWHGDRVARTLPSAYVATISLGAPRRFLMRPFGGWTPLAYNLGWGDLLVMGGSCQRTWQHCVPKVRQAQPRIALMLRPVWEDQPAQPAKQEAAR